MPDIMHTVLGFHHSPQRHCLDGILLTGTFNVSHQGIQRPGDGSLRAAGLHLITELGDELAQILELRGVWLVVDTIRKRLGLCTLLHASYRFCHCLIGQQHKLLYQLVSIS